MPLYVPDTSPYIALKTSGTTGDNQMCIRDSSKRVWQFPPVRAIQTGLEIEDDSTSLAELAQGGCPNAWPFAIVEELGACHEDSVYDIQPISKGKKGVLFWRTGTDNE